MIGLAESGRKQKKLILKNEAMYLELIGQITEFIEAKAAQLMENGKRESLVSTLERTINHMDQDILILGRMVSSLRPTIRTENSWELGWLFYTGNCRNYQFEN